MEVDILFNVNARGCDAGTSILNRVTIQNRIILNCLTEREFWGDFGRIRQLSVKNVCVDS